MTNECEHGQLKRSCNICELELEVLELNGQLLLAESVMDQLKPYTVTQRQIVNKYHRVKLIKVDNNE